MRDMAGLNLICQIILIRNSSLLSLRFHTVPYLSIYSKAASAESLKRWEGVDI